MNYLQSEKESFSSSAAHSFRISDGLRSLSLVSLIPRLVEVHVVFLQIGEVDTINEKYQATVKIKARWCEKSITTEYDPNVHWNPKLFIENALNEKFKEEITYETAQINDKVLVTESRICKGTFWERMVNNSSSFYIDLCEIVIELLFYNF